MVSLKIMFQEITWDKYLFWRSHLVVSQESFLAGTGGLYRIYRGSNPDRWHAKQKSYALCYHSSHQGLNILYYRTKTRKDLMIQ